MSVGRCQRNICSFVRWDGREVPVNQRKKVCMSVGECYGEGLMWTREYAQWVIRKKRDRVTL